ncbi:hypothetical protein GIB67_011760 [Kingdonia uniflora]|uniref:Leucine-rich repeat-containing N-terminal plant-type domain-containing protein n=1 Tax=Kingdonia uniflora TaxID=39325 RepID=A0A7J7ND62_9MAGN|nr:hypothetical protein GIB67_016095 [Kingdonia uniflora]KAF6164994.1 hypothetical protein GIB67_011760 [Kingdonia uniflora]
MAQLQLLLLLLLVSLTLQTQPSPPKLNPIDFAALFSIKSTLSDLPGSNFFASWDFLSPHPCSTFSGITCSFESDSLRVDTLTLGTGLVNSSGLTGSLSNSITNLTSLTQLVLYSGIVTGSIPSQIGELTHLRVISLTNNRLSGGIPISITMLRDLHTLDLSYNELSGSVPPSLTSLPSLKVLVLESNRFLGEFPAVLTQLLHLDLRNNGFSGELMLLPLSIRYLSVSQNQMWGPLNNLFSLSSSELVYLDLSMNHFNGTIPQYFFTNPNLSTMLLQRNNLTGGIVSLVDFRHYGEGSTVDLSHNFLSGELSVALAGVENVFLNNNRFTGVVPTEYVKSLSAGSMKTLYVQHNYLTGISTEADGLLLSGSISICISYNCMVPGVADNGGCPVSAGGLLSRPASQCIEFKNGSTSLLQH